MTLKELEAELEALLTKAKAEAVAGEQAAIVAVSNLVMVAIVNVERIPLAIEHLVHPKPVATDSSLVP